MTVYLKTLELHGFKSFPEKTVLHFNPGATIIVGPNGSGKSNVTDAMRWVLGELSSKNIRGTKMEDVIFVGADGHRPMSFAEVSVTFDDSEEPRKLNCPYEEVTVTRRYYRAGESEYYINRKPCRLKDINELFMNTGIGREGYSIVGQGRIAEIISKKSDDRRGIFEETAGITKFRYKKNEAQKKLAETDDNMTRVMDIYTEIESRIGPLERDAIKARKYLELYDEKKRLDVSLWLHDVEKIRVDVDKFTTECLHSAHELEMETDKETALEVKSDRLFELSQEAKQKSSALYEAIKRLTGEINAAENKYRILENDIHHAETRINAAQDARGRSLEAADRENQYLENQKKRYGEIGTALDTAKADIERMTAEKAEKQSLIEKLDAELEEKLAERISHENNASEMTVRLEVLKAGISDRSKREKDVRADIEKYEKNLSEINEELSECAETVETYETALNKSDDAVAECDRSILELSDKIEVSRREYGEAQAELKALESRIGALKRMQEHFEGFNNSVKFVMTRANEGRLDGVRGPLSNLIRVDERYIVALETAFGAALQNIVVDDEKCAKAAIKMLKDAGAGRATFYPISSMKSQGRTRELDEAKNEKGFVGYANELLSCDKQYEDIVGYIVGRIAVFDNIDNATDVARSSGWKLRIVTLDGQQINMGGSFTGGSVRKDSGMLSRTSHIDKLESDRRSYETKTAEYAEKLKAYSDKSNELVSYRRKEDEKAKLSEVLLRSERARLEELKANKDVCENLLNQLRSDIENIGEADRQGEEDIVSLEASISGEKNICEAINAEREDISIRRSAAEDDRDALTEKIGEIQIKLATLMADGENAAEIIRVSEERKQNLEKEADEFDGQREELEAHILDIRQQIEAKKEEAVNLRAQLSETETEREKQESTATDFDTRLNDIRRQLKDVTAKKEILFRAHTANQSKLDSLNTEIDKMTSRLWDEYELTHSTALALDYPPVTLETRASSASRLAELKSQVKSLGHVNVGAIEEYTQLHERYEYLKGQIEDLNASKGELEKIIGTIEEEMKRMFADAFEKINKYFGETFNELFGGGNAYLSLTDPDNILTSGVEINAAPPGKMIKSLSLLSGGEQAFVAIALIFALIRVNPTPFCIFDEIEAALDEVNVTRVANYVRRFSKELQIIMISHRRGMMETADTLYGVTMPRRGISKVFTLDVNSVAEDREKLQQLIEDK